MRRRFTLTPQARSDLRDILLDIAEDSPDAAERLREEFYERLQTLAAQPGIGHFHDELLGRAFRFWNFHSYVVVYEWKIRPIRIICVVHGARELAAFLVARAGTE